MEGQIANISDWYLTHYPLTPANIDARYYENAHAQARNRHSGNRSSCKLPW